MIWAKILEYSAGPIIILDGRITASDYVDNSGNGVHSIVQMLLINNDAILKMTLPIHTVRSVQSWFQEHEDALEHLPWPAQSPPLNVFEPPWRVLESRMRSRLPPPSSPEQTEDFPNKEWYSTPLETIQNLYESFSRKIQSVLQENVGPPP